MTNMITLIAIGISVFATVMYARNWYLYRVREYLFWCLVFGVFGSHALYYLIKEGL